MADKDSQDVSSSESFPVVVRARDARGTEGLCNTRQELVDFGHRHGGYGVELRPLGIDKRRRT